MTSTRAKRSVSPMSWVTHSSVASDHRRRARASSAARCSRASPRNGSSRITSAGRGRSTPRPKRTRCPSPPDTRPPASPSGVSAPCGKPPRHLVELRLGDRGREVGGRRGQPEAEVGGERSVPQVHRSDRPRPSAGAAPPARAGPSARPSTVTVARRGPVPAEQQPHQARLPRARCADDRDVLARRDRQRVRPRGSRVPPRRRGRRASGSPRRRPRPATRRGAIASAGSPSLALLGRARAARPGAASGCAAPGTCWTKQRQLVPEHRQRQRPVDGEQPRARRRARPSRAEEADEQPARRGRSRPAPAAPRPPAPRAGRRARRAPIRAADPGARAPAPAPRRASGSPPAPAARRGRSARARRRGCACADRARRRPAAATSGIASIAAASAIARTGAARVQPDERRPR